MITYRYLSDGTKVSAEAVLQPEIDEGDGITPATQGVVCTADTGLYGSEHDNRYRYAGKEEQRFGQQIDLALLDFGARAYDPFTARWTSIDPLAHKYLGMSPYNYCGGNPVMYFDPDGRDWYIAEDSSIKWTDYKSQEEMNENNIAG